MKTYTFLLLFLFSSSVLLAQDIYDYVYSADMQYYLVSDSDGYVNGRKEPTVQSDIVAQIETKRVVARDNSRQVVNGWIPIIDEVGDLTQLQQMYLHSSRLSPMEKPWVQQLFARLGNDIYPETLLNFTYQLYCMSEDTPNLVLISSRGDCETTMYDIDSNEIVFSSNIPMCPLLDVTTTPISFRFLFFNEKKDNYTYQLYIIDDKREMLCSAFNYKPQPMTPQQIADLVKEKNFGMTNEGDSSSNKLAPTAHNLVDAYLNGSEEALRLFRNTKFHLDASLHNDMDHLEYLVAAYQSHQRWKQIFGK